jgi:hypothetical protein
LWQLLEFRLKAEILDKCDALTQFLNFSQNGGDKTSVICKTDSACDMENPIEYSCAKLPFCSEIWRAAFELDWTGDFSLLPHSELPNLRSGLLLVRSRILFLRLLETGYYFGDSNVCNYKEFEEPLFAGRWPILGDLLHVPIQNLWMDVIDTYPSNLKIDVSTSGAHLK